jgi:hypothetical protein
MEYAKVVTLMHLHYEDINGRTPISAAREGDHTDVVKVLSNKRLNTLGWKF